MDCKKENIMECRSLFCTVHSRVKMIAVPENGDEDLIYRYSFIKWDKHPKHCYTDRSKVKLLEEALRINNEIPLMEVRMINNQTKGMIGKSEIATVEIMLININESNGT